MVKKVDELDGFFIDKKLDRCIHITFETEDTIAVDVFKTAEAAYLPVGEILVIVIINFRTGEIKIEKEGER